MSEVSPTEDVHNGVSTSQGPSDQSDEETHEDAVETLALAMNMVPRMLLSDITCRISQYCHMLGTITCQLHHLLPPVTR